MIPFITQILKVEPFKILCLWNTGELRVIDFALLFEEWKKETDQEVLKLVDYEVFKYVSLSEAGTLQWVNVPISLFFKGRTSLHPLELDSVVLYEKSRNFKDYQLVERQMVNTI